MIWDATVRIRCAGEKGRGVLPHGETLDAAAAAEQRMALLGPFAPTERGARARV